MDRLQFKFYKSYFSVAKELNDKDRLAFYDAIMNRQFCGIEPDLTGLLKLAYISQKHSIDAQVKGWEDKQGVKLTETEQYLHPTTGGVKGAVKPPKVQVKEKEEVKEKEKEQVVLPFLSKEFSNTWSDWLKFRSDIKKPYKSKHSIEAVLKILGQNTEQTAIKMIEQSIANGWQGLFPLKNTNPNEPTKPVFYVPNGTYTQ